MMNDIFAGITINGKHTYHDYGLFLSKPPDYGSPEAKTITLDIPGMNGTLDYTEAITGDVTYTNRTQKYKFWCEIGRWRREALKSELMDDIHGQIVQITPDEFPEWYFEGRAAVSFDDIDQWRMKIEIEVDAFPYRLAQKQTEIIVTPYDLSHNEPISYGKGTAYSGKNSAWIFGSETQTDYNFNGVIKFTLKWDASAPRRPTAAIQFNATDGGLYQLNIADTSGAQTIDIPYSDIVIAGVALNKIWRVLVSGVGQVELLATWGGSTYSTVIYNDRMPVSPEIESTFENENPIVTINGVSVVVLEGFNVFPELLLRAGKNELYVSSFTGIGGSLYLRYREGRL